jgi:hypothetical protein
MKFVDIKNDIAFREKAPNLDVIPENVNDEGLIHAYEDADKHNWSKEELLAYDYASMRKADESSKTKRAVEKSLAEERESERKKQEQKDIELVKALYKNGVSLEIIAISVKFPMERIEQILCIND